MRINAKSRFLLATVFSVGLHGAGVALAIKINRFINMPSAPATSLSVIENKPVLPAEPKKPVFIRPIIEPPRTEPPKTELVDREKMLDQLKAQKQALIQRTLQSLRKGEHIILSDFLIKSEVLDRNMDQLKSGSVNLIDESNVRKKYDRILMRIKRQADRHEKTEEKVDEIHHLTHRAALRGYLKRSAGILDVLLEGTYNCATSTALNAAIEDNLVDSKNYGIIFLDPPKDPSKGKSGHMLSWLKEDNNLKQIENTDGGQPRRVPFKNGLRAPKNIFMAAYLVKNGIKPYQLPPDLSRLYYRGSNGDGFPIAGTSTDLPDPGNELIPNKYYSGDFEEAIKNTRILRTAISIYQKAEKNAGDLTISLLHIPEDLAWCEIADRYSLDIINGKPYAQGKNERIGFDSPIFYEDYYTAITAARILSGSGNKSFDRCLPDKEYKTFETYANNLLEGKETEYIGDKFKKCMADPQKAKGMLARLYRSEKVPKNIRYMAFVTLATDLPEDIVLLKNELMGNNGQGFRAFATFGLRQMKGEKAKESAKVFYEVLKRESNPYIKYSIMVGLGVLGHGMEPIKYLESVQLTAKEKITLTARMHRLYPDRLPEQEEVQKLINLIEKEANYTVKANLIAILAINGRTEEALKYAKKLIFPLLLDKDFTVLRNNKQSAETDPVSEAQQLVLALGRINSPKIKDELSAVFAVHPALAPEIADCFIRQGIYSKNILNELRTMLKRIGNDSEAFDYEGMQPWSTTYIALLITLMEELNPTEIPK